MFNVKRNGASVEITDIPQSIPFSVFKNIADETGANEYLVTYRGGKESFEVVIRHDNANMATAVEWLVLVKRNKISEDRSFTEFEEAIFSHLKSIHIQ